MLKKGFVSFLVTICLAAGCSNAQSLSSQTSNTLPEIRKVYLPLKQDVPSDFIPKNIHVVALGDSLTEGVGDTTKRGGYLAYLSNMLKKEKGVNQITISNYGEKGDQTTDLLKKLQNSKIREDIHNADLIIITIGGNDLMKVVRENIFNLSYPIFKSPQEKFEQRLNKIVTTIRKQNQTAYISLIGLYNPFYKWFQNINDLKQILNDWNNGSQMVMQKYDHTLFIKVDDIFENNETNLLYKDKFHPNNHGYELIARRIYLDLNVEQIFKEQEDRLAVENGEKEE